MASFQGCMFECPPYFTPKKYEPQKYLIVVNLWKPLLWAKGKMSISRATVPVVHANVTQLIQDISNYFLYRTVVKFPWKSHAKAWDSLPHTMYWALRRTAESALLLTEPWSLLASSGIFNGDIFEMALFWQVLWNKILNLMGSSSMEEKWAGYSQFCLLRIRMARANCGHSLSARADHRSASRTQKASRSDTHSTRKHGWHSIFTLYTEWFRPGMGCRTGDMAPPG